jgi:hypothetical protein
VIEALPDISTTLFILPPDAKFLPVADLSPRLRGRIGVVEEGNAVITRPGFRVTTRLVPAPLAELLSEFHTASRLTDAVLRFAGTHAQDPIATLDLAFDALATLVEARILVPQDSTDAHALAPSLAAGQEFAGFEIEALVRSLEDTEVYLARATHGGLAALKIARDGRPGVTAMLINEARMLERLAAIDTPRLLADGVEGERAYVAMEWCEGTSIAVAAQQARAARNRARLRDLVGGMFDAYARLHGRGVLHGDVHPGNCVVRDDGRIVILDFGTARSIDSAATVDPGRAGISQFYDPDMAAAVLDGRMPPAATPASEQYALCVLAYLLVTGLQPIDAPAVQNELLLRIVQRAPLPFAARGVASWPDAEAVLGRGLAKAADDRFPDVGSLAAAFRSTGLPPAVKTIVPAPALRAFETTVETIRDLAPSTDPLKDAWFALRAALALEDAELLAAADVLVSLAEPCVTAHYVAALVARARSDARMETSAVSAFLDAAATLPDGARAGAALIEAAALLHGSMARPAETASLVEWASGALDRLFASPPASRRHGPDTTLPVYAALQLARTGALPMPPDVPARLMFLAETRRGDVWLWAAAYDTYGEARFRTLALASRLPQRPLKRGLALLRLHQLTGSMRFADDAVRVLTGAPCARSPIRETALMVAELMAPESAPHRGPIAGIDTK